MAQIGEGRTNRRVQGGGGRAAEFAPASAHRLCKSADCFFPAPARRTVWNNCDLLDAGFFDALDLRAALIDGAGDGEFIDQPVGNDFRMIRLLIHVMIVVVGFADLFQNLLLIGIEHVGKRMGHDARDVGLHGIFSW